MKKVLPVNKPLSTCYQFMAFPLAILSKREECEPWIFNNFIQACFHKDYNNAPVPSYFYIFDFAINPWLQVQRLQRDIIKSMNINIIELIKNAIDMEYYVTLNVDEFYIPERIAYQKFHHTHDILVHGYDDETETLMVLGFNEKMSFEVTTVRYWEFQKAFENLDHIKNNCHQLFLYKYNPEGKYTFNIPLLIESLEDYLYSRNTSNKFSMVSEPWVRAYGMECYDYLKCYLNDFLIGNAKFDIRYLHFLYEHKLFMRERIKFLIKNNFLEDEDLVEEYQGIVETAILFRDIMLKNREEVNPIAVKKIINHIDNLAKYEFNILEKILVQLKEKFSELLYV